MFAHCTNFSVHFDKLICLILALPFYHGNVMNINKWLDQVSFVGHD